MAEKKGFLLVYLFLAGLAGLFGIIDNSLVFFESAGRMYLSAVSLALLFYFCFNLLAIVVFYRQRQEPLAYVLPLYHLLTIILFSLIGLYFASGTSFFVRVSLLIIGYLTSLFEIGFSAYLLKKFGMIK